jgi:hypothetical protein
LVALVLALAPAACQRKQPRVDTIEDENRLPLSVIEMAVILQPPSGAAQKGARLELVLSVPESVISRRKSIALSAAVEGQPLAPESYTKTGEYTFSREVPGSALAAGPVKIDFALDKFLASGEIETRELGLVVRRVALRVK